MLVAPAGAIEGPPGEQQELRNFLEPHIPGTGRQASPECSPVHGRMIANGPGREAEGLTIVSLILILAQLCK